MSPSETCAECSFDHPADCKHVCHVCGLEILDAANVVRNAWGEIAHAYHAPAARETPCARQRAYQARTATVTYATADRLLAAVFPEGVRL